MPAKAGIQEVGIEVAIAFTCLPSYTRQLVTVEIKFPLEFIVEGTAVSQQAKRRESIDQWKARIVEASRSVLPEGHFATEAPLAVTLFYFPAAEMQGDAKPVLYIRISDDPFEELA